MCGSPTALLYNLCHIIISVIVFHTMFSSDLTIGTNTFIPIIQLFYTLDYNSTVSLTAGPKAQGVFNRRGTRHRLQGCVLWETQQPFQYVCSSVIQISSTPTGV